MDLVGYIRVWKMKKATIRERKSKSLNAQDPRPQSVRTTITPSFSRQGTRRQLQLRRTGGLSCRDVVD